MVFWVGVYFNRLIQQLDMVNILRRKSFFIIITAFILAFSLCGSSFAKNGFLKKKKEELPAKKNSVVNVVSDTMDYFQATDTIVAEGSVVVHVEEENNTLMADKVTYDRKNNIITAENNVQIVNERSTINGDYARIDMNKDSILINNPSTIMDQVKIDSKVANIYPNPKDPNKKDIDVFDGKAVMSDKNVSYILSSSAAKYITDNTIVSRQIDSKTESSIKHKYTIHSKKIIVKRNKDFDIITLYNSSITINKFHIANIPNMTLSSNKETNQVETNFPEFGREPRLGGYMGWGPLFNLPGGRTLKVAPILTLDSGAGFGEFARYTSATNRSEIAYSTLKKDFVIKGEQSLPFSPNTKIQYGKNAYVENGFFGRQLPEFIIEAVHNKKVASADKFDFDMRSSAAFIQNDHRWSTGRYQVQGNIYNNEPLLNIKDTILFGANSQFDVSVYGNGDTYGVLRAGPSITIAKGPFYSWLTYYQGGIYGKTPIPADRYYYGKSNVTFATRYKITRYATIGYEASLNLSKDNYDRKLLAENQIFLWVGPDDVKFRLAYDTRRKVPTFDFNMLLGSDKTNLEFDKMKVTEK